MKSITILFLFLFIGSLTFAQTITQKDTIQKRTQINSVKNQSLKKEELGIKEVQDLQSREIKKRNQEVQDIHITPESSGVKRSIGYKFSTIPEDSDPGNGIFRYNDGKVSQVTYIFVDNNDLSGEDQTKWYATWDDTTGASARGGITIVENEENIVNVFNVTGVLVKGDGYWKIPVEYISGNLPANGTNYYYIFSRITHKKPQEDKEDQGIQLVQEVQPEPAQEPQPVQEVQPVQEPQPVQPTQNNETVGENVVHGNIGEKRKENIEKRISQGDQVTQSTSITQASRTTQPTRITQPTQLTRTKPVMKTDQPPQTTQTTEPVRTTQTTQPSQPKQAIKITKPIQTTQTSQPSRTTQTTQATQTTQTTQTTQIAQKTQTPQTKQPAQTPQASQITQGAQGVQSSQRIPATQSDMITQGSQTGINQNYFGSTGKVRRKCYIGIIEAGYALGIGNYGINNFRFNFINGIRIGKCSSIGLGIGFRRYYEEYENYTDRYLFSNRNQMPVFLDFRTSFSTRKVTPYLALGIGGSAGLDSTENRQEGLFLSPSAGIWFNISDRIAVFTGVAYELQKLEYVLISDNSHFKGNTSSISLNIGISF